MLQYHVTTVSCVELMMMIIHPPSERCRFFFSFFSCSKSKAEGRMQELSVPVILWTAPIQQQSAEVSSVEGQDVKSVKVWKFSQRKVFQLAKNKKWKSLKHGGQYSRLDRMVLHWSQNRETTQILLTLYLHSHLCLLNSAALSSKFSGFLCVFTFHLFSCISQLPLICNVASSNLNRCPTWNGIKVTPL